MAEPRIAKKDTEVLEKIRSQVQDEQPATGKLRKVLYFDDKGEALGETPSSQLPEDPFTGKMDRVGLQSPPYALEQLVLLAESHPIHQSALEQKAADVVGQGWRWDAETENLKEDEEPDEEVRAELDDWLKGLAGDGEEEFHELLAQSVDDYLAIGQGFLEIARDATGAVAQMYYVPGHTLRFHHDGVRIAQIRGSKMVWFKRWGTPPDEDGQEQEVDRQYGSVKPAGQIPAARVANELLVFQKRSRRSSWYGIPGYVSAIGWISLALSARDDNLLFFQNRREPRWAVILTNLEDDPDLEDDLKGAFAVDLKSPHRNLLIPLTGNGKIEFKQLSADRADGSYEKLSDRADAAILVSHRMPPERLGLTKVGALGGDVSIDSTRVYKEAVVEPEQKLLSTRLNRFIAREFPRGGVVQAGPDAAKQPLLWRWSPVEIDLAEEEQDLKKAINAFKFNLVSLDEARQMAGMDKLDEEAYPGMGAKFFSDLNPGKDPGAPAGEFAMSFGRGDMGDSVETALSLGRVESAIAELLGRED